MQAHNQGEAAVTCLGGEQSPCALKWKWNCYTSTAIEEGICVGRGTTILDRHCGRSFGFALLQSEIYKKEMLGYSKEAPDGGKTKGTSHYPPWGTCTPKLHFSALLFILSTSSPPECSCLCCSIFLNFFLPFFLFLSLCTYPYFSHFISLVFCHVHPACSASASLSCTPSCPCSHFLSFSLSLYFLLSAFLSLCSLSVSLSQAMCWLAQSKTLY